MSYWRPVGDGNVRLYVFRRIDKAGESTNPIVFKDEEGKWWAAFNNYSTRNNEKLGPYDTLKQAQAIAVLL